MDLRLSALLKTTALILSCSMLLGCATSLPHREQAYLAASVADITSTYVGLDRGATEVNPLYDGTKEEVVLQMIAVNALVFWLIKRANPSPKVWNFLTIFRIGVVVWNVNEMNKL